ncbi:methyltransferase [Sphingobium chlorophenolicum]|uniref:Methyltransferase small n=1 Tax=Sphingobium chlorophenolicum TaxID=46429 RepID=A0A081RB54_SPHCR|nr:class I SAM-dependent methyltransferase [Sphingobium chlorophenolicum]KEQ52427.1 Methyltransferase small [Sphingobium chlorophenolicum]
MSPLDIAVEAELRRDPAGRDEALHNLLLWLKGQNYAFVAPTPLTHARILRRTGSSPARTLRDVFGWNLSFHPGLLPAPMMDLLRRADMVEAAGDAIKSRVRVSSLGGDLFLHSGYPTRARDAVFFGPDSYRFAEMIRQQLSLIPVSPGSRIADMGTGAGVGAVTLARLRPDARILMTDVNPAALRFARINAGLAGIEARQALGDRLDPREGRFDLIVANPPYIADGMGRAYRDGGDMHGAAVALHMTREALPRRNGGGRFLLYSGSAIVEGADALRERLSMLAREHGCALRYSEVDPDIFGEELEQPAYRDVERIALVWAMFEML